MGWTFWLSVTGLAIACGLGVFGLLNPTGVSRLVRLREDRAGGAAEFRSTYGGLFLGVHGLGLALALLVAQEVESFHGIPTYWTWMGVAAACAMIWLGTAAGRVASILADRGATAFNAASLAFEMAIGLALAAPWLEFFARS